MSLPRVHFRTARVKPWAVGAGLAATSVIGLTLFFLANHRDKSGAESHEMDLSDIDSAKLKHRLENDSQEMFQQLIRLYLNDYRVSLIELVPPYSDGIGYVLRVSLDQPIPSNEFADFEKAVIAAVASLLEVEPTMD